MMASTGLKVLCTALLDIKMINNDNTLNATSFVQHCLLPSCGTKLTIRFCLNRRMVGMKCPVTDSSCSYLKKSGTKWQRRELTSPRFSSSTISLQPSIYFFFVVYSSLPCVLLG
ncbi:hypothetical protein GOODEAATRI_024890 [Goodea atripinnis]|uniref:Uncharacterized protein n=1 Tax=Goodea atripinnis TaxID=208336 RepID=A0ABV0PGX1_9TELE